MFNYRYKYDEPGSFKKIILSYMLVHLTNIPKSIICKHSMYEHNG